MHPLGLSPLGYFRYRYMSQTRSIMGWLHSKFLYNLYPYISFRQDKLYILSFCGWVGDWILLLEVLPGYTIWKVQAQYFLLLELLAIAAVIDSYEFPMHYFSSSYLRCTPILHVLSSTLSLYLPPTQSFLFVSPPHPTTPIISIFSPF